VKEEKSLVIGHWSLVIGEEKNGARAFLRARAFLPVSSFMEFLTAKAPSTPREEGEEKSLVIGH
jgi:hypothetical protein